jgi:hypothetical protein
MLRRRVAALLAWSLGALGPYPACGCTSRWLLGASDETVPDTGAEVEPPIARESRASKDWSYRPNYNYGCTAVGCCGAANASFPRRQPW